MEKVIIQGIKANDHRIISRVITRIENDDYVHEKRFIELYDQAQKAIRLGITGPPGAGRSANVVALEASEVLTLARNDFLEILQEYPKISISFLEELTQRIRKSDQQIESLSLSDVEQRIGITLIRLAEELGTIKRGSVKIKNLPYQQDIANMAGTSRETVSRTFKLLEEKGLVAREGRKLTIYNFNQFTKTFS